MTTDISIGSIAVAKLKTDACFVGELGVCFGKSVFEGQAVYGLIFETGPFMIFSADEVAQVLNVIGRICEAVAGYRNANDAQLKVDYRVGRFAAAFPPLKENREGWQHPTLVVFRGVSMAAGSIISP
jgi:hypothetical protein